MARLRGRNGAPLEETERRLVILCKLYSKRHRHGAPWSWLQRQAGISHYEMQWRMKRLRNRKAVIFWENVPYTTYATKAGLEAALHPDEEVAERTG